MNPRRLGDDELIESAKEQERNRIARMFDEMATHAPCQCHAPPGSAELQHEPYCPVAVALRYARAVRMLGKD